MNEKWTHIVLVDFLNHFFNTRIIEAKLQTSLLKLIMSDIATSIFIKVWKSSKQVILFLDFVEMQRRSYKLSIVNCPAIISISLVSESRTYQFKDLNTPFKTVDMLEETWRVKDFFPLICSNFDFSPLAFLTLKFVIYVYQIQLFRSFRRMEKLKFVKLNLVGKRRKKLKLVN